MKRPHALVPVAPQPDLAQLVRDVHELKSLMSGGADDFLDNFDRKRDMLLRCAALYDADREARMHLELFFGLLESHYLDTGKSRNPEEVHLKARAAARDGG